MRLNTNEIEKKRKYLGMTQEMFAEDIGIKLATYKNLLKSANFRTEQLIKISKKLKINISSLFINDNSDYQVNNGDNNQIVNDGKAEYKSGCEKLRVENRDLKKEIKYLKEIVELLKEGK